MAKKKVVGKAGVQQVEIPAVRMNEVVIPIVGLDGPLVVHAWGQKAIGEMLSKQMGETITFREPKNPEEDYKACLYSDGNGRYGFPASSFKKSMIAAAADVEGITMTQLRRSVFVVADFEEKRPMSFIFKRKTGKLDEKGKPVLEEVSFTHVVNTQCVEIKGTPQMRMDPVRIGGFGKGVADLRFRPEFPIWKAKLHIRYTDAIRDASHIVNLVNLAGLVGIGEGRPGKGTDMGWGKFTVDASVSKKKRGKA